jgi:lipopolysaccharide/colanic/teichoic acid biosynthesis glycosyltransferase
MSKRLLDLIVAGSGLVLLAPLFALIAVAIRLDTEGPVVFRQERVGRGGSTFRIHKFRTMVVDAERLGPQVTAGVDPRVTRVGAFLRRYRLDELPQLIDVLSGDMSLVGPRPEVPQYVLAYPPQLKAKILSVRPGITDPVAVEFLDESARLGAARNPEREYIEHILPVKLTKYADYIDRRTCWSDLAIVFATLARLVKQR